MVSTYFFEPALDSVLGDIRRVLDAKELRHHLRELAVVDGVAAVDVEVLKTATDLWALGIRNQVEVNVGSNTKKNVGELVLGYMEAEFCKLL